jgi:hypothetical protein
MDEAFKKVFQDGIKRQMSQNEEARQPLEGFLGNLRSRTEQMMMQGGGDPAPAMVMPADPALAPPPEESPLNEVSQDWVKTVVQAASLDLGFLQDTGARATQIVMAQLQKPPAEDSAVPTSVNSG